MGMCPVELVESVRVTRADVNSLEKQIHAHVGYEDIDCWILKIADNGGAVREVICFTSIDPGKADTEPEI